MARPKGATLQEKAFAREYVLGDEPGNGGAALRKTWKPKPSIGMQKVHPTRLLERPAVKAEIQRLLEKFHLSEEDIFEKFSEGMNAKTVVVSKGEVYESEVPDYNTRHKYVQDLAKIHRLFPNERKENLNVNLDMQLEKMSKTEIAALLKGLLKDVE